MVADRSPRETPRERDAARRSEALRLAGELVKAGLIGSDQMLAQAKAYERYLRDGSTATP